jgi:hypothetical protein
MYGQLYLRIQGRPIKIQTAVHRNLVGDTMIVPPQVIAQQYSSTIFVSLRFHSRNEKSGAGIELAPPESKAREKSLRIWTKFEFNQI